MIDVLLARFCAPEHVWAIGVNVAVKATLLLVVALLLDRVLRARHVLACCSVWNACLIALAFLPLTAMLLPRLRIECLPSQTAVADAGTLTTGSEVSASAEATLLMPKPERWEIAKPAEGEIPMTSADQSVHSQEPLAAAETTTGQRDASAIPAAETSAAATLPQSIPWQTWLLSAYLAGMTIIAVRLACSFRAVRSLRRSSVALTDPAWTDALHRWRRKLGIRRNVRLARCEQIDTPVVVGWLRPVILVPAPIVATTTTGQRNAILVHELAHIHRADLLWQWLLDVLQIVYWLHPLTWITGRSIRSVREQACDDYCIHWLGNHREYATALLDLAAGMMRCRRLAVGMVAMRSSKIERRLAHIDQSPGSPQCRCGWKTRALLLGAAAALTVALGSVELCRVDATADELAADATEESTVAVVAADDVLDPFGEQAGTEATALERRWPAEVGGVRRTRSAEQAYSGMGACIRSGDTATAAATFAELERNHPEHNRTGCAALYLAQTYQRAGDDDNAEKFFRRAIKQYDRCRYGDGVQVGAYATYLLADLVRRRGRTQEAETLLKQLVDQYSNAVDHRRRSLRDLVLRGQGAPRAAKPKHATLEFALRDVFGRQVRSSDYIGTPLLLQFGACW